MNSLAARSPRKPAGSRRFTPPRRARLADWPSGPWPRRHAVYFELPAQFARRERHARVVEDHREGNFSLGLWVSKRRSAYRKGLLTPEQVRSLEKLRGWTWSPRDDAFERGLNLLKAFVKREGHAHVPQNHVAANFKLGPGSPAIETISARAGCAGTGRAHWRPCPAGAGGRATTVFQARCLLCVDS